MSAPEDDRDQSAVTDEDHSVAAAVLKLSRPHPDGGRVIERAAVLAAGPGARSMLAWVIEHGHPEALPQPAAAPGLHGDRASGGSDPRRPLRYVVPAAALPMVDEQPPG